MILDAPPVPKEATTVHNGLARLKADFYAAISVRVSTGPNGDRETAYYFHRMDRAGGRVTVELLGAGSGQCGHRLCELTTALTLLGEQERPPAELAPPAREDGQEALW